MVFKAERLGSESSEFCESMYIFSHSRVCSLCCLSRLVLEFNLLSYAFGKLQTVVWTWSAMFLSTLFIPYFLFQHWARGYSKSSHPLIRSLVHGLLFMVFQLGILGFVPTYIVLAYTLPPASRFIVILEQVRFSVSPNTMSCLVKVILITILTLLYLAVLT